MEEKLTEWLKKIVLFLGNYEDNWVLFFGQPIYETFLGTPRAKLDHPAFLRLFLCQPVTGWRNRDAIRTGERGRGRGKEKEKGKKLLGSRDGSERNMFFREGGGVRGEGYQKSPPKIYGKRRTWSQFRKEWDEKCHQRIFLGEGKRDLSVHTHTKKRNFYCFQEENSFVLWNRTGSLTI